MTRTAGHAAALATLVALVAGCGSDDGGRSSAENGAAGAPARAAPAPARATSPPTPLTLVRWGYRDDPTATGLRRGWHRGRFRSRNVFLPHSPNGRDVRGPAGRLSYAGSVGWYRRTIAARGGRYSLRFGSAHHRATVWIDGRRVADHTGAYEAFGVRTRLRPGHHVIVVRVDWRSPERQRAEGWARGWFNFGGLNRPVTIARLGRSELGLLRIQTRLPGRMTERRAAAERGEAAQQGDPRVARVGVAVRVRNAGPPRTLRVAARLERPGRTVPIPLGAARLLTGEGADLHATVMIDDPVLWSPRDPQLWNLVLEVPGETVVRRRVGLRELRWDDGGLRLNGRRLVLAGVSVPPDVEGRGDAFTAADADRVVEQLRAAGANATRAQHPLPAALLDRFDAAGILVWQQIGPWDPAGAWSARTPAQRARATERVRRTLDAQQTHPSIVAWSLGNEVTGNGHPAGQGTWIDATAGLLHRLDPGRPVGVDLWGRHLPRAPGLVTRRLDVVGVTDYTGWYEEPGAPPAVQAARVRDRIATLRRLFPGRPIVVTEFGTASNRRNPAAAPGGLRYQAHLLARRARELRRARVAGMIAWTLRDFALRPDFTGGSIERVAPHIHLTPGLNEKGVFTYGGHAKPAVAALRQAFAPVTGR